MKRSAAQTILSNHYLIIKNLSQEEAVGGITLALRFCAEVYCGIKNDDLNDSVLSECVLFIYRNYKTISVNEIKLAFEMGANNEIDVNMIAYYGKFTVSMLGDILSEFSKRRNKLIIELQNLHQKNLRGETFVNEVDHKNFVARQEVIKEFKTELENVKKGLPRKYNSYEEIRIHWPKILIDNNIIQLDAETKSKLWEQAKHLVKREHQKKAADFTNMMEAKHNRALLKSFEEAGNQTFQSKCDAIYSKLFVWEFLKEK
jgi:hypothetical protein